ncbi:uncharacterized protein [Clytia hemisphaerica]|uniref:uncharacterized protein n=1 Tax=Clytia hemisphaerica TaxID=252671 RepID=UPI0034D40709
MEKDHVYLVYESQLDKLFKTCQVCGEAIIETKKIENEGTQYRRKMNCLGGCQTEWSSQPKATNFKGIGNLMVTAAAELSGISFPKLKRFAHVLNLKIMGRTTFFDLRGTHLFPEIKRTWKSHQKKLIEEVDSREDKSGT